MINDQSLRHYQFQIDAIQALEEGRSAVVAAPSGSGKTLIAAYVLQRHLIGGGGGIYTTPNEEKCHHQFREWSRQFGTQIGLLTGDVSIRSDAPILVMTTEIFRNALLDRPERFSDIESVIIDDLHEMNNETQGTVWEESILLAPKSISFLCLSVPPPNLDELARWLEHLHKKKVVLIQENERPSPPVGYLFLPGYGIGTLAAIEEIRRAAPVKQRQLLSQREADVVRHICVQGQLPALYFCYRRKRCEDLAFEYSEWGHIQKNSETSADTPSFNQTLSDYDALCKTHNISEDEAMTRLRNCIACGIAYHHDGMPPMHRAVVEQLFTEGRIQLVFSTLPNLTAKTVIIDGLEKLDRTRWRPLKPEEHDQLSGRAAHGGNVYVCVDALKIEASTVNEIINGDFSAINSHLNPSYATILSMYQRPEFDDWPDFDGWIEKSFRVFQRLKPSDTSMPQAPTLDSEELLPVECIHGQPHLIVEYQQLSESLAPQKTAVKKHQRELKRAKGDEKQVVIDMLNQLQMRVDETEVARNNLLCADCPHRGECMRRSQQLQKAERTVSRLVEQKASPVNATVDEIVRRVAFLESLGYIRDGQLTSKGQFARKLHREDIVIAELLFDGYFDQLDEVEVNVLVSAVGGGTPSDVGEKHPSNWNLGRNSANLERRLQRFVERQRAFGIDSPLNLTNTVFERVVRAWSEDCDFKDLAKFTDAAPEDIVAKLRQTLRRLCQLERCLPAGTEVRDKIGRCIARMQRNSIT